MPFTKKKKKRNIRRCTKCNCFLKNEEEDICDRCLKLLEEEIQIEYPVEKRQKISLVEDRNDSNETTTLVESRDEMDIEDQDNSSHRDESLTITADSCCNCQRINDNPNFPLLEMYFVKKEQINFQRISSCMNPSEQLDEVLLCSECKVALTSVDVKKYKNWKYYWPAWFWKLIKKSFLDQQYYVWHFIPKEWRPWWLMKVYDDANNNNILLNDECEYYFTDITLEKDWFHRENEKKLAVTMRNIYNKHCVCTVRCPWGCTEFIYKTGTLRFDYVINKFFTESKNTELFYKGEVDAKNFNFPNIVDKYIKCPRLDYLTLKDTIIGKPILPSIAFIKDKGPCVLTCRYHNGGSSELYLHPPLNPINDNLCSIRSDQLAPAVVAPRSAKPMKLNKYSTTFQMYEVQGNFDGLDSCHLLSYGNLNHKSDMSFNSEILQLIGRSDIQKKLDCLLLENKISIDDYQNYMKAKNEKILDENLKEKVRESLYGSTFMNPRDCVELRKTIAKSSKSTIEVIDDDGNSETRFFSPPWFTYHIKVHNYDTYGAPPPTLPSLFVVGSDMRFFWYLSSMLILISDLWSNVARNVRNNSDWYGWVLNYITKKCLNPNSNISNKSNPFRPFKDGKEIMELFFNDYFDNKFQVDNVALLFSNFSNVTVLHENVFLENTFVEGTPECLIVYRENERRCECEYDIFHYYDSIYNNEKSYKYKLSYVGTSEMNYYDVNNWKASILSRNSECSICTSWWIHERGESCSILNMNLIPDKFKKNWEIAIWIVVESPEISNLKKLCLDYIGCQTKVVCETHYSPLIKSLKDCGRECNVYNNITNHVCNMKSKYCYICPHPNCNACICQKHYNECTAVDDHPNISRFIPHLSNEFLEATVNYNQVEKIREPCEELFDNISIQTQEEDDSIDLFINKIEHEFDSVNKLCDENDMSISNDEGNGKIDDNMMEVCNSVDESVASSIFDIDDFLITQTGADLIDEFELDHNETRENEVSNIPTTNIGRNAFEMTNPQGIPGHVLLNNYGDSLVRTGHSLKANLSEQHMIESIVATSEDNCVSLLYSEAMCYPSIFYSATLEGSIIGALPLSMLTSNERLNKMGFASVENHMICRLANHSLACSRNPNYACNFAFTAISNAKLKNVDQRYIIKRGFDELLGEQKMSHVENCSSLFLDDPYVVSEKLNKLAASLREKESTYFFTTTANQKDHFGLKPIFEWIQNQITAIEQSIEFGHGLDKLNMNEKIKSIVNSCTIQLVRTWMEVSEVLMDYICFSPEKPLGDIDTFFWLHEWQGLKGNLSHIHGLLTTLLNKKNPEDLSKMLEKITCCSKSIVDSLDIDKYFDQGLISSIEEGFELHDKAIRFQHKADCERNDHRCCKKGKDGKLICRQANYTRNRHNMGEYEYESIDVNFSNDVKEILQKLDLLTIENTNEIYHDKLKAGKFLYPAHPGEIMVPTNSDLFAITQSSQNILLTDFYLVCRYLAKYMVSMDANAKVHFKSKDDYKKMEADIENLYNTKITGSRIQTEKEQQERLDYHKPKGFLFCITQAITHIFKYVTEKTNNNYVKIPCLPLQERLAIKVFRKQKRKLTIITDEDGNQYEDIQDEYEQVDANEVRDDLCFETWRKFNEDELEIISDVQTSNLSVDLTTAYGIRAPELRSIATNQVDYIRWFKRAKYVKDLSNCLHGDIKKCAWVDGTNFLIQVRPIAIHCILSLPNEYFIDLDLKKLFQFLYDHCISDVVSNYEKFPRISNPTPYEMSDFIIPGETSIQFYKDTFIFSDYKSYNLPVCVFNTVKPTNTHCFLVYLLLSMGTFSNEVSLYKNASSIKQCFVRAKLLREYSNENPIVEKDIYPILTKYIIQHILYVPEGTKSFGNYIVCAYQTLMNCLVYNMNPLNETPPYLNCQLVANANVDLEKNLFKRKETVLTTLHADLLNKVNNLPSLDSFLNCSIEHPLQWIPDLTQTDGQSSESVQEQKVALSICMKSIHSYLDLSSKEVPKNVILCGTPGSGKTHLLRIMSLYCISKGLTTFITASQSARAIVLGGVHLHKTFLFPFHNLTKNVYRSAALTIERLKRNPLVLAALQRMHILCVDENGQQSAEIWSVIDIVLRRIRRSHLYLGGVLKFSTMDIRQLPPFDGKPFLLSPYILTSYKICKLVHSVRARNDPILQRLNDIARKTNFTEEELDEFESIIQNHCQHVDSWNSDKISPFMIRIFGKKSATKKSEKEYIEHIKQQYPNEYVSRKCIDLQTTSSEHGNWTEAAPKTSRQLSRHIKELEELYLYPKAPVEFTHNRTGYWSQSQLGIVMRVPSQDDLDNWRSISVYVSPAGTSDIPSFDITEENLIANGWIERRVGCAPERVHNLRYGLMAKRKQYGIAHRFAGTIHRLMGSDLSSIVTSVKLYESDYCIWLSEQVVVLLSRTSFVKDIMFVGDKKETSKALRKIIQKVSPFQQYMDRIVENLHLESLKEYESDSMISTTTIDISQIPFQLSNFDLPSLSIGYVYIIVSLTDRKTCRIYKTFRLRHEMKNHNQGFNYENDSSSNVSLRPWILLGFICGFNCEDSIILPFYNFFKSECSRKKLMDKPMEIISFAKEHTTDYCIGEEKVSLRFVQCINSII